MAISLLHNWAVLQHAPSAKLITLCRVSKLSQGTHSTKVFDISPRAHCCAPIVIADQLGTETEREGEKERERGSVIEQSVLSISKVSQRSQKAIKEKTIYQRDERPPKRKSEPEMNFNPLGQQIQIQMQIQLQQIHWQLLRPSRAAQGRG